MTHPGEDHRDPGFVCARNDLLVAQRAAGRAEVERKVEAARHGAQALHEVLGRPRQQEILAPVGRRTAPARAQQRAVKDRRRDTGTGITPVGNVALQTCRR